MSKVFYDKPIIDQIFEEFYKNENKKDKDKLLNLIERLPPENVNTQNNSGSTALMIASINGYSKIVKLLLEKEGIDVNIQNKYGSTALTEAYRHDRTEIVELLENYQKIEL